MDYVAYLRYGSKWRAFVGPGLAQRPRPGRYTLREETRVAWMSSENPVYATTMTNEALLSKADTRRELMKMITGKQMISLCRVDMKKAIEYLEIKEKLSATVREGLWSFSPFSNNFYYFSQIGRNMTHLFASVSSCLKCVKYLLTALKPRSSLLEIFAQLNRCLIR